MVADMKTVVYLLDYGDEYGNVYGIWAFSTREKAAEHEATLIPKEHEYTRIRPIEVDNPKNHLFR